MFFGNMSTLWLLVLFNSYLIIITLFFCLFYKIKVSDYFLHAVIISYIILDLIHDNIL